MHFHGTVENCQIVGDKYMNKLKNGLVHSSISGGRTNVGDGTTPQQATNPSHFPTKPLTHSFPNFDPQVTNSDYTKAVITNSLLSLGYVPFPMPAQIPRPIDERKEAISSSSHPSISPDRLLTLIQGLGISPEQVRAEFSELHTTTRKLMQIEASMPGNESDRLEVKTFLKQVSKYMGVRLSIGEEDIGTDQFVDVSTSLLLQIGFPLNELNKPVLLSTMNRFRLAADGKFESFLGAWKYFADAARKLREVAKEDDPFLRRAIQNAIGRDVRQIDELFFEELRNKLIADAMRDIKMDIEVWHSVGLANFEAGSRSKDEQIEKGQRRVAERIESSRSVALLKMEIDWGIRWVRVCVKSKVPGEAVREVLRSDFPLIYCEQELGYEGEMTHRCRRVCSLTRRFCPEHSKSYCVAGKSGPWAQK